VHDATNLCILNRSHFNSAMVMYCNVDKTATEVIASAEV